MAEAGSVSITDTDGGSGFELTTSRGKGIFSIDLQPPQEFEVPVIITFAWDDLNDDGVVDGTNAKESNLIVTKDNVVITGKCKEELTGEEDLLGCDMTANTFEFEVLGWSEFALVYTTDPKVTSIEAPVDPVNKYDQPINVTGAFTDEDDDNSHSAQWDWGDGTTTTVDKLDGNIDQTANNVTGSHTYAEAGVYTVVLTVTDSYPNSASKTSEYIVVYDPNGGFVTSGGWINSPSGAYAPDPDLTGKATFGFVSKYRRGATTPTGNTEFQFRAADLNFHSHSYEWLVLAGPQAKFKGTGTINGSGDYSFMLTATDEKLTPSTAVDLFRIKIWDTATEAVVYDNKPGEAEDSDAGTEIGGGSIVIHKK